MVQQVAAVLQHPARLGRLARLVAHAAIASESTCRGLLGAQRGKLGAKCGGLVVLAIGAQVVVPRAQNHDLVLQIGVTLFAHRDLCRLFSECHK